MTQEDVQRWVKDWKKDCQTVKRSFTSVADVPSKGRAHENSDISNYDKRSVQHSDLEYKYNLYARFNSQVSEIETQYPLIDENNEILPQAPTMEIEHAFEIPEAVFVGSKTNWVCTEDFLLTLDVDGGEPMVARTIKYLKDLVFFPDDSSKTKKSKQRTWQLLTVQRTFFESRGVPWKIITENSISEIVVANLERMLIYVDNQKTITDESLSDEILRCFENTCNTINRKEELNYLLDKAANMAGIPYEDTVKIFWQLCWQQYITFDLNSIRLELDTTFEPNEFFLFQ